MEEKGKIEYKRESTMSELELPRWNTLILKRA
jgi:hypothetical protein